MGEMNIFGERMLKKSLILSKAAFWVFCLFVCPTIQKPCCRQTPQAFT